MKTLSGKDIAKQPPVDFEKTEVFRTPPIKPSGRRPQNRPTFLIPALVIGATATTIILLTQGRNSQPAVTVVEATSTGTVGASVSMVAEGTIAPKSLAYVNALPNLRDPITRVYVETGDRVKKGQILADIDPMTQQAALEKAEADLRSARASASLVRSPYRAEQLRQVRAQLQQAHQQVAEQQAALDLLKNGADPREVAVVAAEADTARANLNQAKQRFEAFRKLDPGTQPEVAAAAAEAETAQAHLSQAEKRYTAFKKLLEEGAVSRLQYDQAETDVAAARAELSRAREALNAVRRTLQLQQAQSETDLATAKSALNQVEQRYALVKRGARAELIREAVARVSQAKANEAAAAQALALLEAGSRDEQTVQAGSVVTQAEAEVRYRRQIMRNHVLRSPIDGVVATRNINPGEIPAGDGNRNSADSAFAVNSQALFVIAGNDRPEFQANVDQRYLGSIKTGQAATVEIESLPGKKFAGKVVRVNPVVAPSSAIANNNSLAPLTFPVWIRILTPDVRLMPGLTGFATLTGKRSGVVVPQAAVVPISSGQGVVFVEKDGKVQARNVRFRQGGAQKAILSEGVSSGERVVVSDPKRLTSGAKVRATLTSARPSGQSPL
ncbi:MAG: efflux RND transporter periplasmic adaptor subunit [Capsulimonadales bacterium]|nr:efflux RND transporter periplasmic adaptor subunit [Capsulimonadales bacterium]